MRRSRRSDILFALAGEEGATWEELVYRFPRKTLERHLDKLLEEKCIERIVEPSLKGRRGRRSTRYKLKTWHSCGGLYMIQPAKKIGNVWFPGVKRRNPGKKADLLIGAEKKVFTNHVVLSGEWKEAYEQYKWELWFQKYKPVQYKEFLEQQSRVFRLVTLIKRVRET